MVVLDKEHNSEIKIDAWFCCKCHAYNKPITIEFEVPKEYIPKTTTRPCYDCGNVSRVGTSGKEVV